MTIYASETKFPAGEMQKTAERTEGVGVPPARDLFQKLLDNQVPVYV